MTASAMPADKFWQIIARAAKADHNPDAHMEALRTALRELTLEEIIAFEVAFRRYLNEAYTWDLWGAAYVVHGECSDDGFEYFRRWLVTRGRDVYERALADPDSLAQQDVRSGHDGVWEFELIYYVAMEVFEEKGGEGDVREQSSRRLAWTGLGHPVSLLRRTRPNLPSATPSYGNGSEPIRSRDHSVDPYGRHHHPPNARRPSASPPIHSTSGTGGIVRHSSDGPTARRVGGRLAAVIALGRFAQNNTLTRDVEERLINVAIARPTQALSTSLWAGLPASAQTLLGGHSRWNLRPHGYNA